MRKAFIVLLLSIVNCQLSFCQVGTWKNYLSYYDVQDIQSAGSDLFVRASDALYQYNLQDHSIYTYDKIKGLSDTDITIIRWCKQAKRLIVIYQNTNIDLVDVSGNVTNISDIYQKALTGDKTINNVIVNGQYAYLSCGFGVVKLNVKQAEVSESYMLGFPITAVAIKDGTIYAQSKSQGVWAASLSANLIDIANWHQVASGYPSFDEDRTDYNQYIEEVKTLKPGGPKYNYTLFLRFKNHKLYSCNGILGGKFNPGNPAIVQVWDGENWQIYEDDLRSITGHDFKDLACVDVDPNDNSHVFAGGRIGLYEYKNGQFIKEYTYDNSELRSNATLDHQSKNYTMVQSLLYDDNGSLWLINSASATTSIFEVKPNGQWVSHHQTAFMNTGGRSHDNIVNAMFDSRGILWACNDRFIEPALLCYQPSTGTALAYTTFVNQDGTALENVYGVTCVDEDREGNIWFGTDRGLILIEKDQIGKDPYDIVFTQVKVPRNDGTNYADYLLGGVHITSIMVDNDNKKWIGTNGQGVYVISDDNMTEVHHFTTENSMLLSDIVGSIAINKETGEVFIGTEKGLCSYMSGITNVITEMTESTVWAYPNPVTPEYTGSITITGLTNNADVKILSANGALITEGRSNGRFFTWDGKDRNGKKVASGVYMVVTATSSGEKGVVCKIAIIN